MNARLCGVMFLAVIAFPAADVAAQSTANLIAEPPPRLVPYKTFCNGVTYFAGAANCTTVTVVIYKWNGTSWDVFSTPTPGWEVNAVLEGVDWGIGETVLAPGTFIATARFYNGTTLLHAVNTNTLTWP